LIRFSLVNADLQHGAIKAEIGILIRSFKIEVVPERQLGESASKTVKPGKSSSLSLITAGSSMNAALGSVSAGGLGSPELDVTQSGGGPCTFVAIQPGGNVGGVTPSKFSPNSTGFQQQQSGHCGGTGTGTAAEISLSELPPARWPRAREEPVAAKVAMPAATKNNKQNRRRTRGGVNLRFEFVVIELPVRLLVWLVVNGREATPLAKTADRCQYESFQRQNVPASRLRLP